MTFLDAVGAPAHLSGRPFAANNIPAIQSTFDFDPEEPRKRNETIGRNTAIILVQIGPVVLTLEQFSGMQSEREQTLV